MRTFSLIIFLLIVGNSAALAQSAVAASIRPLQLIAAAITEGISEPLLVMDGSQDPHHPSLRPSQRRAMNQADIFLWVGPQLETGMERIVEELDARILTIMATPGLTLYPLNNTADPHIWLNTHNAGLIADLLARTLIEMDRQKQDQYLDNLKIFQEKLELIEAEVAKTLLADSFPPFAVYHNGYQYFERQFGLSHAASFTNNEEVQPGIRQVLAIKLTLDEMKVNCIVVDPSVNTMNLNNQLGRDAMHYVPVDVLAHDIELGSDSYFIFIKRLAANFASCRQ